MGVKVLPLDKLRLFESTADSSLPQADACEAQLWERTCSCLSTPTRFSDVSELNSMIPDANATVIW